jgi:hypothetical protein
MNTLQGTIRNGYIVLDLPGALAEGTRVEVLPVQSAGSQGMREEDWPTTPAGIAELLSRMDQHGSDWLSPDDEAAWRGALASQREVEKARFATEAEKLRRGWE